VGKKTLKEAMAQSPKEGIRLRGFYKLQIENQDGSIAGDSGWNENMTTNLGFHHYICFNLGKIAGSKQIAYAGLGTGGAPASNATTLPGEVMASTKKTALTAASSSNSHAVQFTATFGSAQSFITKTYDISNIGLFDTNGATDTLFAGNTFASSTADTNQNVNISYTLNFTTA